MVAYVPCTPSSVQGRHLALQVSDSEQTRPETSLAQKDCALFVCLPVSIAISLCEQSAEQPCALWGSALPGQRGQKPQDKFHIHLSLNRMGAS